MPNLVKIWWTIDEIWWFFDFPKWRPTPTWIFKISNFQRSTASRESNCIVVPNSVEIGQTAVKIWRVFLFFQDGSRPPPWFVVCVIGPPTKVVFISVQKLVGIDALVLIITKFSILRVWLENAYSHPFLWGFWGTFHPDNVTHCPNPKKDRAWAKPCHLSHKACTLAAQFELGVGARKKDRTAKKVTKELYFTHLWRSPHSPLKWSTSKTVQ